ncbi:MAG: MoaD/ThiS family protein [Nitrospinae bacterium]|nr:MoaD/ThiS family protein [Nitrospinota bacterium]
MATVRFFASVRDRVKNESVEIPLAKPLPLRDVLAKTAAALKVDEVALINPSLLYAVNKNMEGLDFIVNNNDEVAVLPPLSGG